MSSLNKYGIRPFDGKNFSQFMFRIQAILEEYECHEVIKEGHVGTKKKIALAKSILIQSVSDQYIDMIRDCVTPREIVETLKANFEKRSLTEQMLLKRKLANLKYDEKTPMKDYLFEFECLIREMRDTGLAIDDAEKVCNLLLSMPKAYDNVTCSIETMIQNETMQNQGVSYEFVKNRLLSEEIRLHQMKKPMSEKLECTEYVKPTVFSAQVVRCYICNQIGHIKRNCPKLNNQFNGYQNHPFSGNPNNRFSGNPNNRFSGNRNHQFSGNTNHQFSGNPNHQFSGNSQFKNEYAGEMLQK
uniref:Copia protein n=1 Tax=Cacopsylla melanoneura TaxID=428564 RepID=A0A8D8WL42_9HEMI